MSKKKSKTKNVILLCIILFVAGFFVGQFAHIPAFDDYNIFGFMGGRPGGNSHRM